MNSYFLYELPLRLNVARRLTVCLRDIYSAQVRQSFFLLWRDNDDSDGRFLALRVTRRLVFLGRIFVFSLSLSSSVSICTYVLYLTIGMLAIFTDPNFAIFMQNMFISDDNVIFNPTPLPFPPHFWISWLIRGELRI